MGMVEIFRACTDGASALASMIQGRGEVGY